MSNNKQSSIQQFWDKIALKLSVEQINQFLPLLEQAKAMHKEEMIDFHIEVMKAGLIKEGEAIWTDAYLPKISSMASQKYNETFGGNNEQQ